MAELGWQARLIAADRERWRALEAERDAAIRERDRAVETRENANAVSLRVEAERDFWKGRYDTQHDTLHRCEDALASARAERDRWIRLWNRLEAAVTHHQKATAQLTSDADEALYAARDRILRAAVEREDTRR